MHHVALTFDDAPCRLGPQNSRVHDVLTLLQAWNAHASFMTIGQYANGHEQDLINVLRAGNELGNHGMLDRPYHEDSPDQFSKAVDDCSELIQSLHHKAGVEGGGVRWFRAPHGKYTRTMEEVLQKRQMTNVMCDTYASCPIVEDGDFIGRFLARKAKHGSIILLHMPERGLREWCLVALQRLLVGLAERGLRAVTVSQLEKLATGS